MKRSKKYDNIDKRPAYINRGLSVFYNNIKEDGTLGTCIMTSNASSVNRNSINFPSDKNFKCDFYDVTTNKIKRRDKDGNLDASRPDIDILAEGGKII